MKHKNETARVHKLVGIDRFGYSCLATCQCGWSSAMHPTEDRAWMAFGAHLVQRWIPMRRVRP